MLKRRRDQGFYHVQESVYSIPTESSMARGSKARAECHRLDPLLCRGKWDVHINSRFSAYNDSRRHLTCSPTYNESYTPSSFSYGYHFFHIYSLKSTGTGQFATHTFNPEINTNHHVQRQHGRRYWPLPSPRRASSMLTVY
jgi:hypothetical protein